MQTNTIAFTRGTSFEFKLDTLLEVFIADEKVKIGLDKNKIPIFGKIVFEDDADDLFAKRLVRFVSHIRIDEYVTCNNLVKKTTLTRILSIDTITTITKYGG